MLSRLKGAWERRGRYIFGSRIFASEVFGHFRFKCDSHREYYRTIKFGAEASALGAFLFLLRQEDVVWDIGASVGLFTVHASPRVARVIAFEPDPATYTRLVENVALNHETNVIPRAEALGEAPGTVRLSTDGLDGNAPAIADLGRHEFTVEVPVETVDGLIASGVQKPTVMKIDIEGAELSALRGSMGLLGSERRPRLVFLEVHPEFLPRFGGSLADVLAVLKANHYRIMSTNIREDQYHIVATSDAE